MFVFNVKFNLKLFVKILFIIMAIIVIWAFIYSTYKIIKKSIKVKDELKSPEISYIEPDNYTNILKSCYDDLDEHIGKTICFSGYIYRAIDFKDNQFVLARDMVTDDLNKTFIVGFLCETNKLKDFTENDWVEIVGDISKGSYHGTIPVIKIQKIKKVAKPENAQVLPPDNTYIQTSILF